MDCNRCFKLIPDFLVKYYLEGKQRCPYCMVFHSIETPEDRFKSNQEEFRLQAESDMKEKVS